MTSSSAFNSLPTAMPSRFAPRPVARAPKAVREWQILEPTTTGPFTPSNKIITINIPTLCDFLLPFYFFFHIVYYLRR